jgi:hypothetical protein
MHFFAIHTNDHLSHLGDFQSPLEAAPYAQQEDIVMMVTIDTLRSWLDYFCQLRPTQDGYMGIKSDSSIVFLGEHPTQELAQAVVTDPVVAQAASLDPEYIKDIVWVAWCKNMVQWCQAVNNVTHRNLYTF